MRTIKITQNEEMQREKSFEKSHKVPYQMRKIGQSTVLDIKKTNTFKVIASKFVREQLKKPCRH